LIHVEAGLRSGDRRMPEEINRVLTDRISDLLFTTESDAASNLEREGVDPEQVHFVGNVMIDTLLYNRPRASRPADLLAGLPGGERMLGEDGYGLLTLHRPSNVDEPEVLQRLLTVLRELSEALPLVFPVHPRTRARIEAAGLSDQLKGGMLALPPVGYLDMVGLMDGARLVLTDSGGIQEETTALGVPCITLRENTERPVTVTAGTNTVVGTDPERIRAAFQEVLEGRGKAGRIPELWDGRAAERIAEAIAGWARDRLG
jgi:UDP-N-acetylglucosamine 2-epimerase (non-hydrolysing)